MRESVCDGEMGEERKGREGKGEIEIEIERGREGERVSVRESCSATVEIYCSVVPC